MLGTWWQSQELPSRDLKFDLELGGKASIVFAPEKNFKQLRLYVQQEPIVRGRTMIMWIRVKELHPCRHLC